MMRQSTWYVLTLVATFALAGCGSQSKSSGSAASSGSAELTQYQRDSMLSTSRIPGAAGVGAAMRAADATSRGIRSADSVSP
jgi:hypothetical protein